MKSIYRFILIIFCILICADISMALPAKNVILFIGDGMGMEAVEAGRIYKVGPGGSLAMEGLDYLGSLATDSLSYPTVTDSAAAGTALATGHKVYNGNVSQLGTEEYQTILELADSLGKRTGLVTTCEMAHATPAVFGAHNLYRTDYYDIARDYIYDSQPDVLFGGGCLSGFDTGLISEAQSTYGYSYVANKTELDSLDMNTEDNVLGLFTSSGHMTYEYDRSLGTNEPHLSYMTSKAIDLLEEDENGFFLMVEGGRIDHAAHNNDIDRLCYEVAEFDNAIEIALDWMGLSEDTIVLITADHETGGLEVLDGSYTIGDIPDVTWSSLTHTHTQVPLWANVPVVGATHLTSVYDLMHTAMIPEPTTITMITLGSLLFGVSKKRHGGA